MQTMPPILVVTRPEAAGQAFIKKMRQASSTVFVPLLSPGLRIVPLDASIPSSLDHVVFTSQNGVAQAARLNVPKTAHAWCVGESTASAARQLGFEITQGGGDASQLLNLLLDQRLAGKIAHIRGKHTRGDFAQILQGAGQQCVDVYAYDQIVNPPSSELKSALLGEQPLVVPLFSARSGLTLTYESWRAPVHVVAMSSYVADAATDWGVDTVQIAEAPTEDAMIRQTCTTLFHLSQSL